MFENAVIGHGNDSSHEREEWWGNLRCLKDRPPSLLRSCGGPGQSRLRSVSYGAQGGGPASEEYHKGKCRMQNAKCRMQDAYGDAETEPGAEPPASARLGSRAGSC